MNKPAADNNCMNPLCTFRESKKMDPTEGEEIFPTLKTCAACKKVAYSTEMKSQAANWPVHKPICKKLSRAANIPTMDTLHLAQDELAKVLNGTHAPVSERLRHHSIDSSDNTDPNSLRAQKFLAKLEKHIEHLSEYAFQKASDTRDGGLVCFNVNYPVPIAAATDEGKLIWIPSAGVDVIGDETLKRLVADYDLNSTFVMLLVIPSADGLSADIWPIERPLMMRDWARDQIMMMSEMKEGRMRPSGRRQ